MSPRQAFMLVFTLHDHISSSSHHVFSQTSHPSNTLYVQWFDQTVPSISTFHTSNPYSGKWRLPPPTILWALHFIEEIYCTSYWLKTMQTNNEYVTLTHAHTQVTPDWASSNVSEQLQQSTDSVKAPKESLKALTSSRDWTVIHTTSSSSSLDPHAHPTRWGKGQGIQYAASPTPTTTRLLLHPFNGLFSTSTWVSRHQKGKPFWILLQQEMMGWQWHQLDHMQIICTSLQTDNHASTSPLSFLQAATQQQCQSTEGESLTPTPTINHKHVT